MTFDMLTRKDLIHRLAETGAYFSRHLRNAWTGERNRTTLRLADFHGRNTDLWTIARLQPPLIDIADVADLPGVVYMGAADQHAWTYDRWKAEIEKRLPGALHPRKETDPMKDQTQLPFFSAGGGLPLFSQPQPPPDPYRCHACGTFLDDPGDRCPECCPDCPDHAGFPDCSACEKTQAMPKAPTLCESCLERPATGEVYGAPLCEPCAERELATLKKLGIPSKETV